MSPEFERATDAERQKRVVTVGEVATVELSPGAATHIVPGNNMTLSFVTLEPNRYYPVHSHPQEQLVVVLKGEMDSILERKLFHARTGDVVLIPGYLEHGTQTLDEECLVLEVFAPARKEFEDKLREANAAAR